MLTPKQAAARAGVSPSLVYSWVEGRLLPHYRLGAKGKRGKILIDESDLAAFLAGCRVGPTPPPAAAPPAGPSQFVFLPPS